VPPVQLAVADPSIKPLQLMLLLTILAVTEAGAVIVKLDVVVQLFASEIVTVYVPAATPVMLAVAAALLHR